MGNTMGETHRKNGDLPNKKIGKKPWDFPGWFFMMPPGLVVTSPQELYGIYDTYIYSIHDNLNPPPEATGLKSGLSGTWRQVKQLNFEAMW